MKVRLAQPTDAIEVAGVHVRSWQVGYRGLLPAEYLDGLRPEERATHYRFGDAGSSDRTTLVAVEGRSIVGFATIGPASDSGAPGTGELYALYVEPARWGHGVDRMLLERARTRMANQGFGDARLWVLAGNSRAERFYTRDGWTTDGSRREDTVWGTTVEEIGFSRPLP